MPLARQLNKSPAYERRSEPSEFLRVFDHSIRKFCNGRAAKARFGAKRSAEEKWKKKFEALRKDMDEECTRREDLEQLTSNLLDRIDKQDGIITKLLESQGKSERMLDEERQRHDESKETLSDRIDEQNAIIFQQRERGELCEKEQVKNEEKIKRLEVLNQQQLKESEEHRQQFSKQIEEAGKTTKSCSDWW
jgi:hypothetical protein